MAGGLRDPRLGRLGGLQCQSRVGPAGEAPRGLKDHPGLRWELRGPTLPWVQLGVRGGSNTDPGREKGQSLRKAPGDVHSINPRMV